MEYAVANRNAADACARRTCNNNDKSHTHACAYLSLCKQAACCTEPPSKADWAAVAERNGDYARPRREEANKVENVLQDNEKKAKRTWRKV